MTRGITILQVFLVAVVLGLIAAVLFPVWACACGGGARVAACLSNEKQLGLASLMYAYDYDNKLMPRDAWMDVTEPYFKVKEIERCPGLRDEAANNIQIYGYAFNSRLSQRDPESLGKPEELPLHYDSINLAKNASDPFSSLPNPPRKHGERSRNNVCYADGHAKGLPFKPDN